MFGGGQLTASLLGSFWLERGFSFSIATIVLNEQFFFTLAGAAKCIDWTALRGWSESEEGSIGVACLLFWAEEPLVTATSVDVIIEVKREISLRAALPTT